MLVLHVHPYVSDVCLLQVGVDKSIDGLASPLTQLREEVLVSFTLPSTHPQLPLSTSSRAHIQYVYVHVL